MLSGSRTKRGGPRVLVALGLLSAAGACVSRPSQTYRSTYQTSETGPAETRSWTSLAEIGIQENLGADLEYKLSERLIYTDQVNRNEGVETRSERLLNQPSFDLLLGFGALRWIQGYEYQENRLIIDNGLDNELSRADVLQRLEWTPENLPNVRAWIDYRTEEDDQFLDQETLESVIEIDQTIGPFDYQYSFQNEETDFVGTDVESLRTQHIFRGGYRKQFLDGRVSSSLSVFLDERRNRTESPTGPTPPVQVFPLAGLSVVDSTPQIASLQSNSLLIDSELNTSAGINIGGFASGGQLDWNIGLEIPPGSTIDLLRLTTQDEVDPFLVNQFSFSVWASDDNVFWTLVASSATFTYDAVFERFELTIPEISQRFVKIVNTAAPAAAPAVLVTELQMLLSPAGGGIGSSVVRTDDSIRSLTGNLSWRVTDALVLTYDLLAQTSENEIQQAKTRDERRIDHGLTSFWTPHPLFDVTLRAQTQDMEDDIQLDEEFLYLNGQVVSHPLETLDVTLAYTETRRDRAGLDVLDTTAAQLGASAQLLDTLLADFVFELNIQEDFENQRDIDRTILSAALAAELTRRLDMSIGVRNEQADVSGPGADAIPDPSEERYELVVVYQASDRFTADAQLEWVDTFAGAGIDQRYRIDWIPFRDGSLDVQFSLDRMDTRSTVSERVDRYQILTRWTVTPRAFFEINYSTQVPEESDRTDLVQLSFNATI